MLHKMIGLLGVGVLFLSGCAVVESSKVDPSAVQTTYRASYDEQNRELSYQASFQVGNDLGTYVRFDDGSEVRIDSRAMMVEDFLGMISYRATLKSPSSEELSKTHTFAYKNVQCQGGACGNPSDVFQNSFRLPGRIFVDEAQDKTASLKAPFVVRWRVADQVGSGENISATLRQGGSRSADEHVSTISDLSVQGASGTVIIPLETMAKLTLGSAEIWICRESVLREIESPSDDGRLTTEYCSKRASLKILE